MFSLVIDTESLVQVCRNAIQEKYQIHVYNSTQTESYTLYKQSPTQTEFYTNRVLYKQSTILNLTMFNYKTCFSSKPLG